jgi:putative mRNA 3-end processing factor
LLSLNDAYAQAGVKLPPTQYLSADSKPPKSGGALVIAPPSVQNSPWLRKFGNYEIGFASGWMQIRGIKRRKNLDRGFVLSDHTDWPGLLQTIERTQAEKILVTHGYSHTLANYLNQKGRNAAVLQTEFTGETTDTDNATFSTDAANAAEQSNFE